MEYFKSCFRKVDLDILDEYKKEYQGSPKEENDVKAAYLAVCHLIPVTAVFVLNTLIRLISTDVSFWGEPLSNSDIFRRGSQCHGDMDKIIERIDYSNVTG